MFDTEEEALDYQPNPKGRDWLGAKLYMRVAFRPWEVQTWTHDTVKLLPGPEDEEEFNERKEREYEEKEALKEEKRKAKENA